MARDSAATRERILAAAVKEFSAFGLAGARIDRIADTATANKRSIYVYFESKELLFAAALHRVIGELTEAVPVTEDDLPGYAGRVFDHLVDHPEALRMSMWRHLERPAAGPDEADAYARKLEAMTGTRQPGRAAAAASGLPALDLLVLIQGLAASWLISPADLLAADGGDPYSAERLAAHRATLVEAVRRICAPRAGATGETAPGG